MSSVSILRPPVLISALFLLTILLRIPQLNRPLSKHHEFATAHSLLLINNWLKDGPAAYYGCPSITMSGKSNLHINNWSLKFAHKNGKYYYFSHPPLAYYLPYAFARISGLRATPALLKSFSLAFHLASALLIFLILSEFKALEFPIPLMTAGLYLVQPATLWFQGNIYSPDLAVFPFYLLTVWLFIRRKKLPFLFLLSLIPLLWTEWLGWLTAFTFGFSLLLRKGGGERRLGMATLFISLLMGFLLLALYSRPLGPDLLLKYFAQRFSERGPGAFSHAAYRTLMGYVAGYAPILLFLIFRLIRIRLSKTEFQKFPTRHLILILPVILHHFIFLQYSAQDLSVLKGSLPICFAFAWVLHRHPEKYTGSGRKFLPILMLIAASILLFEWINPPGKSSFRGHPYAAQQELGGQIENITPPGSVIFLSRAVPDPQLIYYAGANIKPIESAEEALKFLGFTGNDSGVIIRIKNLRFYSAETVTLLPRFAPER